MSDPPFLAANECGLLTGSSWAGGRLIGPDPPSALQSGPSWLRIHPFEISKRRWARASAAEMPASSFPGASTSTSSLCGSRLLSCLPQEALGQVRPGSSLPSWRSPLRRSCLLKANTSCLSKACHGDRAAVLPFFTGIYCFLPFLTGSLGGAARRSPPAASVAPTPPLLMEAYLPCSARFLVPWRPGPVHDAASHHRPDAAWPAGSGAGCLLHHSETPIRVPGPLSLCSRPRGTRGALLSSPCSQPTNTVTILHWLSSRTKQLMPLGEGKGFLLKETSPRPVKK